MACFIVPGTEAIVVTAAYVIAKKREQKLLTLKTANKGSVDTGSASVQWSKKLSWLLGLLWGGVLLLAFEHFWHGEVVPFPPFLSAMSSPADTAEMLHEMATVGVSMAVSVTVIWGVICGIVDAKVKKVKASMKKQVA